MNEEQVVTLLGKRGKHQFTAQLDSLVVRCVEYRQMEVFGRYYLVFINGYLSSVCHPVPLRKCMEQYGDAWSVSSIFEDPELHMQRILAAPNLLGTSLLEELDAPLAKSELPGDPGLTVVAAITRVISPLFSNPFLEKRRCQEWRKLLERYDPFAVSLGASSKTVKEQLGLFCFSEEMPQGHELRGYGSKKHALPGSEREFVWMGVVYENDKAIRVYS